MLSVNVLILLFWMHCLQHHSSSAQQTINPDETPSGLLNTTAWSIIYTYPLSAFANFVGSTLGRVQTNQFLHYRQLAGLEHDALLQLPSTDILYSMAVLDLSQFDIVLTIPEVPADRYWNYPIYDPFGNAIVELGVANGNLSGDYLIRRADDVHTLPGYLTADGSFSNLQGIVSLPGSYATMLVRILVRQNTTEETETVNGYQNASHLTPINRSTDVVHAPTLQDIALNGSFLGIQSPEQQLEFAARLVPFNQPEVQSDRSRVNSILANAGLQDGHYHEPSEFNLIEAAIVASSSIRAAVESPSARMDFGDQWYMQRPDYQGNFGTHYAEAAAVALVAYQEQTAVQTLYPQLKGSTLAGFYELSPNMSVLFTFSGKPKLKSSGFWSLSVYGVDRYLIPNSINRYEIGDRTWDLKYEDGTPIYGPEADASKDGPFQILVQPADLEPPQNWTGNWLPTQTEFLLILRCYVPEPVMTDGSYVYPKVENITAFV